LFLCPIRPGLLFAVLAFFVALVKGQALVVRLERLVQMKANALTFECLYRPIFSLQSVLKMITALQPCGTPS